MARPSSFALAAALAAAVVVLGSLPHGARAQSGLAGDPCNNDSDCMSRTCGSDNACVATTCGMTTAEGGIGATMPANYCTPIQFYNPARVCTFGFGKCAKAECCDTLSCGAGVPDLDKPIYCPAGKTFAATRLCTGGQCSQTTCCVQTRCDGAGGVMVSKRATFCPAGYMFNNAGLCAGGQGRCTADDCCALDTRSCAVAFADPVANLSCPSPTVLVGTRIYDANVANGDCCATKTCATGVADNLKATFCAGLSNYVFVGTPACPLDSGCTSSDCCRSTKGFCDGDATKQTDGSCTCPAGKSYVIGAGCLCSPGTALVSGTCQPCPHGTYSAAPTNAATCTQCPTNQPYTSSTGAGSADNCVNYCDEALLSGSGACSNGGTCSSLSGGAGGSFSCACLGTWMGYGATPTNNCDAPTTLLRLRVLPASGVALPADFKLYVNDTTKVESYALQAPTLACSLSDNPTTPTVPSCTTGGAGALATASGPATDTINFVGTQVKLSTNYAALVAAGTVADADFVIEWACSDGVEGKTAELSIVLPGPANLKGAQTLVCTAIVSHPVMTAPIKLQLAAGSVVPVAATAGSGAALLTFAQGEGPICTLPMPGAAPSTAAALECAYNEQPFEGGKPGALGVSNVDMEKYTVAWTCGSPATSRTTDPDGNAATPNLPSPGQAVLVCAANFQPKKTQVVLTVSSVATANIQLTAMQTGMNEACTVTIPAGATNSPVTLSCPVSNLNSGVATTLDTNADLTTYLVAFACTTSAGTSVTGRRSISVETTQNGAATATACAVTISALPPLLYVRVNNVAGAPAFETFASQDKSNTCVIGSTNTATPCDLKDGMMPGVVTTLSPRALDANKYTLAWACTGATAAAPFAQEPFSNSATIMLNANPNAGAEPVTCVGTVGSRGTPVYAYFEDPAQVLALTAEARVRQSHQSKACSAVKPLAATVAPFCEYEGLNAAAGTRTTLSTANVDLALNRVSWSCLSNGASLPMVIVAAGVATVETQGPGTTIVCKASVSAKPPVLMLASTGAGPSTAWNLTARQSTQGRACTVAVAGSSSLTAAAVPTCPIQPLLPARSTVLAASSLDASRWSVAWSCVRSDGTTQVTLSPTISASGATVANSMTVTLDKDANAGGGVVTCTGAVTARNNVLLLAATGAPLTDGWALTAKQSTQKTACSVDAAAARNNGGAAPACTDGVLGFAAGAPVQLGVTGLPASSRVTWSCSAGIVTNGNGGAASVTPPAGAVTTCTATVVAQTTTFLQIAAGNGVAFSASQDTGPSASALCSIDASASTSVLQACSTAAPSTRTTLVATLGAGMAADTIVRFSCKLGSSGANMHVSKTSALSAVVMTPPAVETMVCTASVVAKPPILVVTSNMATVLTAVGQTAGISCTSTAETNKLVCDSGSGTGQLPAETRVTLSQAGLTATGYYRWSCSSSAAAIGRSGDEDKPATSKATVTLPADGKTLTCSLTYTVNAPTLGRLMRRLLM